MTSPTLPTPEWLDAADPVDHKALMAVWDRTATATYPVPAPSSHHKLALKKALLSHIQPTPQVARPTTQATRTRSSSMRYFAFAAFALTVLIGGVLFLQPTTYKTASGQVLAVTLRDGTEVELNGQATLSVPRWLGNTRTVHLEGAAFFDVARDGRTFLVETASAQVEVLGTSFLVDATTATETHVQVNSGLVRVSAGNQAMQVSPGEGVTAQSGQVAPISNENRSSWRTPRLAFENEPLSQVFHAMERIYGITITQEGDFSGYRVSLSHATQDGFQTLMTSLCEIHNRTCTRTATGYLVQ